MAKPTVTQKINAEKYAIAITACVFLFEIKHGSNKPEEDFCSIPQPIAELQDLLRLFYISKEHLTGKTIDEIEKLIEARYRKLSVLIHPDKHADKPELKEQLDRAFICLGQGKEILINNKLVIFEAYNSFFGTFYWHVTTGIQLIFRSLCQVALPAYFVFFNSVFSNMILVLAVVFSALPLLPTFKHVDDDECNDSFLKKFIDFVLKQISNLGVTTIPSALILSGLLIPVLYTLSVIFILKSIYSFSNGLVRLATSPAIIICKLFNIRSHNNSIDNSDDLTFEVEAKSESSSARTIDSTSKKPGLYCNNTVLRLFNIERIDDSSCPVRGSEPAERLMIEWREESPAAPAAR